MRRSQISSLCDSGCHAPVATDPTHRPTVDPIASPFPHEVATSRPIPAGTVVEEAFSLARCGVVPHARSRLHCPRTPSLMPHLRSNDPHAPTAEPTRDTPRCVASSTLSPPPPVGVVSIRLRTTATASRASPPPSVRAGRRHLSVQPTRSMISRRATAWIAWERSVCECGRARDAASSTRQHNYSPLRGESTRPTSRAIHCSEPSRSRRESRTLSPPTTCSRCLARRSTTPHNTSLSPPRPRTTRDRSRDEHFPPRTLTPATAWRDGGAGGRKRKCCR